MCKPRATVAAFLALLAVGAMPAQSQDQQQTFIKAFSGEWRTFEPSLRTGDDLCSITLSPQPKGARYDLQAKNCGGVLAGIDSWAIVQNQLALFVGDAVRARLGGSQVRITGETLEGRAVILEREGGSSPITSVGCVYRGYTSECTEPADRLPPLKAGEQQTKQATVMVKLNLRSQPRSDAPVVTTVPQNTCVAVNECVVASDGPWCNLKIGDQQAWAKQTALRLNRWMILTYKDGCA